MRKVLIGLGILALAAGVFAPAFGAELTQGDRTFGLVERERRAGHELFQGEGSATGDASADAAAEAAAATSPGDSGGNSGDSCGPR